MLASIESILCEDASVRVLLLNFPHNPTGMIVDCSFYEKLGQIVCRRLEQGHPIFVLNDFVYGEMRFDEGAGASLLGAKLLMPYAAESYSLSKAYCVPGWRVGALLGNADLVRRVSRLKSQKDYGIFLPIQTASAAALTARSDLVGPVVREYGERSRIVSHGLLRDNLPSDGWAPVRAQAGGSLWVRLPREVSAILEQEGSSDGNISLSFARELCRRHGVLVMPGCLFGKGYDRYVRLALVTSRERLRVVADKMLLCANEIINGATGSRIAMGE